MSHYYITTPIYYVNDKPHIGHAYTSVACDVLARYRRLCGNSVKFLTGTDERGQKVEKSANAAGMAPQAFVDIGSAHFRTLTQTMGLSNDDFIRTTEPRHIRAAQALWLRMQERGHIYLGSYAGWYAVRDEAYYAESELVNGKAPTGAEVEWVEEPSYFFQLSAFADRLLEWYEKNPHAVGPASRLNEVRSFVKGGLKDLSISRTTFSWGIPVPGDDKHIMYVWLDALANYLSALGFSDNGNEYNDFWPASLHVVGKDIVRFHAVYWPAFLMAADLPLPERIYAHGWWTIEGEKISKSLGNAIPADALVQAYGLDCVRWFLLREVPFGNDGNFAREAVITRCNSELANNIGNLAQRSLSMIAKNCEGRVPASQALSADENAMLWDAKRIENYQQFMDEQSLHRAAELIVSLGMQANEYIDARAPWKQKKEDPVSMAHTLYVLAETIRIIGILLQPFCPAAAGKMLDLLAIPASQRILKHATDEFGLTPGTVLPAPEAIFPRLIAEEGA